MRTSAAATKTMKKIRTSAISTSATVITEIGMKDSDVRELSEEYLNDNLLIRN
jgi:hypothetical protein